MQYDRIFGHYVTLDWMLNGVRGLVDQGKSPRRVVIKYDGTFYTFCLDNRDQFIELYIYICINLLFVLFIFFSIIRKKDIFL
jgi:hypothetical protein